MPTPEDTEKRAADVADLCSFIRDYLDDIERHDDIERLRPRNQDLVLAAVTRAELRLAELKNLLFEAEKRWR
jgi:hypothetical protein